jgi:iron-sulfur cluster assembly accessory protein
MKGIVQQMTKPALLVGILILITGCSDNDAGRTRRVAPNIRSPAIEKAVEKHQVVKLTPAAAAKLRSIRPGQRQGYLRVAVLFEGPTGFTYDLKFDRKLDVKNDYLHNDDGILTVVDKRSALFLEGATIDWQTTADGQQGFKFDNPNAVN